MATRPNQSLAYSIPLDGVNEIAYSECGDNGPDLVAYLCPAGVPTIGWGETEGVHLGDTCTPEQADQWLFDSITDITKKVQSLCTAETGPNELGAMVSLAYNIGVEAFRTSTVLSRHNANDKQSASRAFGLWNKARDPETKQLRELVGLTARRAREAALYLKPAPGAKMTPMPQAVAAETPLTSSKINQASFVSVLAGAGTLTATVSEPIKQVKTTAVDILGIPTDYFLPLVILVAACTAIYWRWEQRRKGWV